MGDAKRRKLAGTYPQPGDPLEAVRRFWCGRKPGRVEDFVAPEETVALTFDIEGVSPSTAVIDVAKVSDVLEKITETTRGLSYYDLVRLIAREFTKAKKAGDEGAFAWIGFIGLWASMNHPQAGEKMRKAVARRLRSDGKAHITWHFGSNGLALSLAEGFVDLELASALAPKDRVTIGGYGDAPAEPAH